MSLETGMAELADLLQELRAADTRFRVFGSPSHQYALPPVLSEDAIREFEGARGVRLPEDYRLFLRTIANGGAGPYYGLETLETAAVPCKPGEPFPFVPPEASAPLDEAGVWRRLERTGTVYVGGEAASRWEDDDRSGTLEICHQGCAIFSYLAVNGPGRGTIWDGNCEGLHPTEKTFREWFGGWAERSLRKVRNEALVEERLRVGMTKAEVVEALDAGWEERPALYRPEPVTYFEAPFIPAQLVLDETGRVVGIEPWYQL
jgi:hypothetical protein